MSKFTTESWSGEVNRDDFQCGIRDYLPTDGGWGQWEGEGSGLGTGGVQAEEEGLDVDTQLSTSGACLREGSDASLVKTKIISDAERSTAFEYITINRFKKRNCGQRHT